MFIDEVKLKLKAGKGGDGVISWRREKYIPKGGPYGGDGGNGGDVILRATTHETTLVNFRHKKVISAEDGERGGTALMHGKTGEDLVLDVPVGTIVSDLEDGTIICDLAKSGQTYRICEGGRGGYGNAHFPSSTRQAPNFAELGDTGDEVEVTLELKLVADVGLVGLPNAGKSTLIQSITNVKPKIAPYPFTTIIPNLGVMEWKGRSLVIEDVPGLIEGASEGKGLGHEFLKHVERTALLIHLIDASLGEEAMIENYRIIRTELENWGPSISEKPEIIILSKADLIDADMLEEMKILFENATGKTVALTISAGAYIRIDELRNQLLEIIPEKSTLVSDIEEIIETPVEQVHYDLKGRKDPKRCQVVRRDDGDFEITGERLEEIVRMTDVRYIDGINRVYDVLEKFNVLKKIKAIVREEMLTSSGGFFEGEDDIPSPSVYVAGKKFSLENVIFMREGRN